MKSILSVCAALLLASCLAACSVYMEATRPTPVDLNDYQPGILRDAVVEKLGAPDSTAFGSDGTNCDFYKLYTRGYGSAVKFPIVLAETAADVFTLGLAELLTSPTEYMTKNEKHPVQFCYNPQKLVRIVDENTPNASANPNPPITAAPSPASGAQPSATPSISPSARPAAAPNPTVGDQWKSSDHPN